MQPIDEKAQLRATTLEQVDALDRYLETHLPRKYRPAYHALQQLQVVRAALCPPDFSNTQIDYARLWRELRILAGEAAQVLAGVAAAS